MSPSPPRPPALDWGAGNYEHTAAQLAPAARVVVDRAEPLSGVRVADIGCGTGNAALLAAERGAEAIGIDPSERLLGVAREAARAHALGVEFRAGTAAALPVGDRSIDVVVSVFGVIFEPEVERAAAELARVLAPGGRIVLSAWIPTGAISNMVAISRAAVQAALGRPEGAPPFPWHDAAALGELFAPHGLAVELEEHPLAFTADSAAAFVALEQRNHPMAVATRGVLGEDVLADVQRRILAVMEEANEDDAGFRVTSRYVVATVR